MRSNKMSQNNLNLERMIKGVATPLVAASIYLTAGCSASQVAYPPVAQPLPTATTSAVTGDSTVRSFKEAEIIYQARYQPATDGAKVFAKDDDYFMINEFKNSLIGRMVAANDDYFNKNPTAKTKQDWEDIKARMSEGYKVALEYTPKGVVFGLEGFGVIVSDVDYFSEEKVNGQVDVDERIPNYVVPVVGNKPTPENFTFPFVKDSETSCTLKIEKIRKAQNGGN